MAAFWAVFTFGGSGPALTAHGSLDLKQEIQVQVQFKLLNGKITAIWDFFFKFRKARSKFKGDYLKICSNDLQKNSQKTRLLCVL
jgi:hypothetical protein